MLRNKDAHWDKNEGDSIPNEELITSIKKYSVFNGQAMFEGFDSNMENFHEWNSLMEKPETIVEKNFQKDIMGEVEKRRIIIDKIVCTV